MILYHLKVSRMMNENYCLVCCKNRSTNNYKNYIDFDLDLYKI